jgi:hypothetical protein
MNIHLHNYFKRALYDYKGDTSIIAQYEIHRSFGSGENGRGQEQVRHRRKEVTVHTEGRACKRLTASSIRV